MKLDFCKYKILKEHYVFNCVSEEGTYTIFPRKTKLIYRNILTFMVKRHIRRQSTTIWELPQNRVPSWGHRTFWGGAPRRPFGDFRCWSLDCQCFRRLFSRVPKRGLSLSSRFTMKILRRGATVRRPKTEYLATTMLRCSDISQTLIRDHTRCRLSNVKSEIKRSFCLLLTRSMGRHMNNHRNFCRN